MVKLLKMHKINLLNKEKVSWFIIFLYKINKISKFSKVYGQTIKNQAEDYKNFKMDQFIMVNINLVSHKVEENLLIIKVKFMKGNGKMD